MQGRLVLQVDHQLPSSNVQPSLESLTSSPSATMFLGYGEDALTFWAIGDHLSILLRALRDETPAEEAIVFYRPSFGRRGSPKDAAERQIYRAEFGEFDAIVGTRAGIYLIETKWSPSSEAKGDLVSISDVQVRRHKAMKCYIEEWRATQPTSWKEFVHRSRIADRLHSHCISVPGERTRMARNLRTVLGLLSLCGSVIRDVLLFMRTETDFVAKRHASPPTVVNASSFSLVGIDCRSSLSGGFLQLRGSAAPEMWLSQPQEWRRRIAVPALASM